MEITTDHVLEHTDDTIWNTYMHCRTFGTIMKRLQISLLASESFRGTYSRSCSATAPTHLKQGVAAALRDQTDGLPLRRQAVVQLDLGRHVLPLRETGHAGFCGNRVLLYVLHNTFRNYNEKKINSHQEKIHKLSLCYLLNQTLKHLDLETKHFKSGNRVHTR